MSPHLPSIVAADVGKRGESIWRGTLAEAGAMVESLPADAAMLFATGAALGEGAKREAAPLLETGAVCAQGAQETRFMVEESRGGM